MQASNRMAEVMKTMAIITVFFMPLSFLAGIYGMNFDREHRQHARARLAVRLSLLLGAGRSSIVVGIFIWLKRKRWLMSRTYRIFGSELSPYSVKVRSYFRYKDLPHEWLLRSPANQAEFQKYAKLPLVPLVVTPDGEGVQDSTPIIERFEAGRQPVDRARRSRARLHLGAARGIRRRVGQQMDVPLSLGLSARRWSTAERIARQMMGAQGALAVAQARAAVAERMSGAAGLRRLQPDDAAADRGLVQARAGDPRRPSGRRGRTCWAAGRPWPTSACGASSTKRRPIRRRARIMRGSAPNVMAWVQRMVTPKAKGRSRPGRRWRPALMPLLKEEVAARCSCPGRRRTPRRSRQGEKSFR